MTMDKIDKRYTVLIDEETHSSLLSHAEFLARVSVPAAKRLINSVYDDIAQLDHEPGRFQRHDNSLYPADCDYRYMVSNKRYKIIYEIIEDLSIVQVVNVIDCRMDEPSE